jgi:hypothetical protein
MKTYLCRLLLSVPALTGLAFGNTIALQLTPQSETVVAGKNISQQVDILGLGLPPAVGAFDLFVSFDPLILTFTGVGFTNLLGDPNLFEALTATSVAPGVVAPKR